MSGDAGSPKGRAAVSLPGQPTEEAIAEVGSAAGQSVVRGFSNLLDAQFSGWTTSKRAKAEAARLAIETDAKIAAERALTDARRQSELGEIEHEGLLRRRLSRMLRELEREQRNLEAIQSKAIEFAEQDPDRDEAREIDQDWLFRVADLAQKVSDKDVQQLWARAISSAAIKRGGQLSAVALQTLGLLDERTARDFRKFVMVYRRLGFLPIVDAEPPLRQVEPQDIDLVDLADLGLIQQQTSTDLYRLPDFDIGAGPTSNIGLARFHNKFVVAKRGAEIANAVFRGQNVDVDEELEQSYLQNLLQREIHHNGGVTIILPGSPERQHDRRTIIVLRAHLSNFPATGQSPVVAGASHRLQNLLGWASDFCSFELR